jgi:hypothetical protein
MMREALSMSVLSSAATTKQVRTIGHASDLLVANGGGSGACFASRERQPAPPLISCSQWTTSKRPPSRYRRSSRACTCGEQ